MGCGVNGAKGAADAAAFAGASPPDLRSGAFYQNRVRRDESGLTRWARARIEGLRMSGGTSCWVISPSGATPALVRICCGDPLPRPGHWLARRPNRAAKLGARRSFVIGARDARVRVLQVHDLPATELVQQHARDDSTDRNIA